MEVDQVLEKLNKNCNNAHIEIQKDILGDLYKLRELMVEESAEAKKNVQCDSGNGIVLFYIVV